MREPGYYWVRRFDNWIISRWDGDKWFPAPALIQDGNNIIWEEIDERRIVRDKHPGFIETSLGTWNKIKEFEP